MFDKLDVFEQLLEQQIERRTDRRLFRKCRQRCQLAAVVLGFLALTCLSSPQLRPSLGALGAAVLSTASPTAATKRT